MRMPDEHHDFQEAAADAGEDRYAPHRQKCAFWSRALVRASEDLRALLNVDESGYRFVSGTAHGAARDYFLYATLDEVEKLGIAVMGWDELIGNDLIEPADATRRVILERSLDEQSFWTRKALEMLIDLACFSQTNEHAYYRHLLLLRDLRQHVSIQQDLTTFRTQAEMRRRKERIEHTDRTASPTMRAARMRR